MNRRQFLKQVGGVGSGAVALVALGLLGGRGATEPAAASGNRETIIYYPPWSTWELEPAAASGNRELEAELDARIAYAMERHPDAKLCAACGDPWCRLSRSA